MNRGKWVSFVAVIVLSFVQVLPVKAESMSLYDVTRQAGYSVKQADTPKSSLVIDSQTGAILWQENAEEVRDPASLNKLMTAYLVFKAIAEQKLTLETSVTATYTHQEISQIVGLSNTTIMAGQRYTIHELLLMALISSSNVASLMLAEQVTNGDLQQFVVLMNETAKTLGLKKTHFTDPSGATFAEYSDILQTSFKNAGVDSASTAKDLGILAYHLIKTYPQVLEYTKQVSVTVGKNTPSPETLENTNFSLQGASQASVGVDGLKTGSSEAAGYNYIATSERNGLRVIEVILGVGSFEDDSAKVVKHYFGNALLDYVFDKYERRVVLEKGHYDANGTEVSVSETVSALVLKNQANTFRFENNQIIVNPSYQTVFDTEYVTKVDVANITQQKEEQRQREDRVRLIILAGAVVAIIVSVLLIKNTKKKRR